MATRFQVKRSSVSGVRPTTSDIQPGELAVNLIDGMLFTANASTVFEVGSNLTSIAVGNSTSRVSANTTQLYANVPVQYITTFAVGNSSTNDGFVVNNTYVNVNHIFRANGTVYLSTTTGSILLGHQQTTGVLRIGGPLQTGVIMVGYSTANQTLTIANGQTTLGNTKTVEIGTAGSSGSITNILIGPNTAGVIGNTVVAGNNLVITANTYINANVNFDSGTLFVDSAANRVGVGTATPAYALDVSIPTSGGRHWFDASEGGPAYYGANGVTGAEYRTYVNGTQYGKLVTNSTAFALVSTNTVPIIFSTNNVQRALVAANGNVGVGNSTPTHMLRVEGDISLSGGLHANGSLGTSGQLLTSNGAGAYWATPSWVTIADQAITSVSEIDVTWTNGAYRAVKAYILSYLPTTPASGTPYFRVRAGGTWLTTVSSYTTQYFVMEGTGYSTALAINSLAYVTDGVANAAGDHGMTVIDIDIGPGVTNGEAGHLIFTKWSGSISRRVFWGQGSTTVGASTIDGLRFGMSGTTWAAVGRILVMGVKA